ncbi:MAG: FtsX-like permease family protein [Candidatus Marinimicrobia bacterium]|nr:FtsX-like permease family protein [Candidatus Neomarinimicrobiota bacterium]
MFKHNLVTALRSMKNQKTQAFILITGMAIGLTVSFWMFHWLIHEFNYENGHANAVNIFRVELQLKDPDRTEFGSATPTPLAPLLKQEYPEVINAARVHPFAETTLHYEDRSFSEDHIMAVDPSFLSMFTFEPLFGSLHGALDMENAVVLTASAGERYFGPDVNPIGKRLHIDGERILTVTAMIRDLPSGTHLDFEILITLNLADRMGREIAQEQWHRYDEIHTYIQLADNASWQKLEEKIAPIHASYVGEGNDRLYLRPLREIHFATDVIHDFASHTDKKMLYGLTLISLLVFVMACINFISLTSAITLKRIAAIELRKVYGAGRGHIINQILTGAFLYSGIAAAFALLCISLTGPVFSRLTSQSVTEGQILSGGAVLLVLALTVIMGIIVGIFPAIKFSGLRTTGTFRDSFHRSISNRLFHPLILAQFILTIVLITGTLVTRQQMAYMQEKPPGYDRDQLVSIPMAMPLGAGIRSERFDAFREDIMQNTGIQNITMSVASPEDISTAADEASWEGQPAGQSVMIHWCSVWFDYFETLGVDIVNGRGFSSKFPGDVSHDGRSANYVLNRTAVEQMGLEDPVGKWFSLYGKRGIIVGIAEDFHFRPLRMPIEPVAFSMLPWVNSVLLIRLSPDRIGESLSAIRSTWEEFNPGIPFEYQFVSSAYQQLYQSEQKTRTLLGVFTVLAIILACLGLFGIISFFTDRRTKEIGIRKVLGASIPGILGLLTQDFVKWILLANLIAWPVAWYAMSKWLQNFAYRIDLTIWPFLLSGLAALAIALITVSWQAIRAATVNPVDALRYE